MPTIPITKSDEPRATEVLSNAFANDPVMNWVSDSPGFLEILFELAVRVFTSHGLCYFDSSKIGVALWMRPGEKLHWPISLRSAIRLARAVGIRSLFRLYNLNSAISKAHPAEPHYYLFAIGVQSSGKGQGIGTKLIAHVLRRCDVERVPAYLENSNRRNLPLYEKLGFKTIETVRLTKDGPLIWLMWREPCESTIKLCDQISYEGP